jgi:hypothetical protein
MMKKSKSNPFTGRWRIVSMSDWDDDYLEEEVQAFIEFKTKGMGTFQFGYVQGRWTVAAPAVKGSLRWSSRGKAATVLMARR